jgi:hypothetical protein
MSFILLLFFFFYEIEIRLMKYRRSFSAPAALLHCSRATCVIVINKQFVKAKTALMKR